MRVCGGESSAVTGQFSSYSEKVRGNIQDGQNGDADIRQENA